MIDWHVLLVALAVLAPASAQTASFDGVWATTVSCPASGDAAGYTLHFPARITSGDLFAENGQPGAPGYLRLSGHVGPDGAALLGADGLVGSPRVAVGRVASMTPYHYTAPTRFTPTRGVGTRTETRPCTLEFRRP